MGSQGSLPCSQGPATGPYPKPDASSTQILTLFPQLSFQRSAPIYSYIFRVIPFLQVFQSEWRVAANVLNVQWRTV
jgi:hypothetical protein